MKKLILLLLSFVAFNYLQGQTAPPESFNFQAIIMEGNKTVKGKPIGIEISIYEGSLYGTLAYQETFVQISDNNGMVSLEIGRGNPVFGDFTQIPWGTNSFFIGISYDPKGGTDYMDMGGSQLLSVPYALYSKKAYALNGPNDDDVTNELQTLSLEGNVLKLSQGGEVTLPAGGNFQFYYADQDDDGFGYNWNVVYADVEPSGYVTNPNDCNDLDSTINPGATEIPEDGIDQNCDGVDLYLDKDGDGFTSDIDCNDNNSEIYPGAPEGCNGIDSNCDGEVCLLNPNYTPCSENGECQSALCWDGYCVPYLPSDGDGDGFYANIPPDLVIIGQYLVDCDDSNPNINPGALEILCDGIDNNCDGQIDEGLDLQTDPNNCGACGAVCPEGYTCTAGICSRIWDYDGDGYSVEDGDCNDTNSSIYPGAEEICDDGIDNNCNGLIDSEELSCSPLIGTPCDGNDTDNCKEGVYVYNNQTQQLECNDFSGDNIEICGDGLDNDCDGSIDEGCQCTDGSTQPCPNGGTQTCINGVWSECITNN